jgi:hypothetical protein
VESKKLERDSASFRTRPKFAPNFELSIDMCSFEGFLLIDRSRVSLFVRPV